MIKYVLIFVLSIFVSSVSQILLKKSANIERKSKVKEYLNLYVILAYGLLVISTLLTMYSYKGIKLSLGVIIESIGYIIVTLLSYFILKEKITKNKVFGIFLIILGVTIFGMSS